VWNQNEARSDGNSSVGFFSLLHSRPGAHDDEHQGHRQDQGNPVSAHHLSFLATMMMTATAIVQTGLLVHLSRNWLTVRVHAALHLRRPRVYLPIVYLALGEAARSETVCSFDENASAGVCRSNGRCPDEYLPRFP
jgi:hypothetical protein